MYTDPHSGLRFLVPEGWTQQAKTNLPVGPISRGEVTLVLYRTFGTNSASFEVSCRDIDEDVDLGEFLGKRKRSGLAWTRVGSATSMECGGKSATRFILEGKPRDTKLTMEVTVIRQGKRVYFLAGTYPSGDSVRRGEIQQFFKDLSWLH
ncbi:MAG: hypothetical protein U0840_05835 [Gemmataceae bacterium]